jgi:hypothetical protein
MKYALHMQSRRWTRSSRQVFAILAIVLTLIGLQPAFGVFASTSHPAHPAARKSTNTSFPWKGGHPACAIRLPIYGSIVYKTFTTCPPKHVLLVGDSVARTIGVQMALNQEDWGTLILDGSLHGCGFVTGYSVEVLGQVTSMNPRCDQEATIWAKDVRIFKPDAIVIELGWWDSFQHLINGQMTSLSQLTYDAMVEQQIHGLIASLRSVSAAPIYFLSVPWMNPGPLPNGQQEPAASAASHDAINALLQIATHSSKAVHFVDISPYITPSGKYETDVDGGACRANDGIELYYSALGPVHYVQTQCGKALQRGVLSMIRQALVPPHPSHGQF